MKKAIEKLLRTAWQEHRGKSLGASMGFILAVSMLLFGFWRTFFVVFCVLIGLWIGMKVDQGEDVLQNLRNFKFNKFNEFHRWK